MSRQARLAMVAVVGLSLAGAANAKAFGAPAMALAGGMGGAAARGTQGYLGVDIRDVAEDQVGALKLKEPRGAEVTRVDHDGPAGKVGLREHDVILQMNGQTVEGQEQLRRMLRETPAGRAITLLISRDGQQQTINTQLANREEVERDAWQRHLSVPDPTPPDPGAPGGGVRSPERADRNDRPDTATPRGGMGFFGGRGLSGAIGGRGDRAMMGSMMVGSSNTGAILETVGPQLAEFFGVANGSGLLVRSVEANSPAAAAGMKAGDVVVKVNQVTVTSGAEWSRAIHESKGKPVNLTVMRDKHEQTLTLTPDPKRKSELEWPAFGPPDGPPGALLARLREQARELQRELDQVE